MEKGYNFKNLAVHILFAEIFPQEKEKRKMKKREMLVWCSTTNITCTCHVDS